LNEDETYTVLAAAASMYRKQEDVGRAFQTENTLPTSDPDYETLIMTVGDKKYTVKATLGDDYVNKVRCVRVLGLEHRCLEFSNLKFIYRK